MGSVKPPSIATTALPILHNWLSKLREDIQKSVIQRKLTRNPEAQRFTSRVYKVDDNTVRGELIFEQYLRFIEMREALAQSPKNEVLIQGITDWVMERRDTLRVRSRRATTPIYGREDARRVAFAIARARLNKGRYEQKKKSFFLGRTYKRITRLEYDTLDAISIDTLNALVQYFESPTPIA